MTARRDANWVRSLASDGMTEDQYQAVIIAEREFGKIQVRQLTRKLATDLGLQPDCMEPPKDPKPRRSLWDEAMASIQVASRYRFSIPKVSASKPAEFKFTVA